MANHGLRGSHVMRAAIGALICVAGVTAQVGWQDADLTAMAGGPAVEPNYALATAYDPAWNAIRTHYISTPDWHIHELFLSGGQWQDADLTAMTGGPVASPGAAVAMAYDPVWRGMRTHYVAQADRHVHELFLYGGRWQDADLTSLTGAPPASGQGHVIATVYDPVWNCLRTHYVTGTSGHVIELYLCPGRPWQHADLTALTGGPGAVADIAIVHDPVWRGMRTHYAAVDGHMHELFLSAAGQWQDADLTAMTGGPLVDHMSAIAAVYDPDWNGVRTHYTSWPDLHVQELFLSAAGRWQNADLTAMTGAPPASSISGRAIVHDPLLHGIRTHYVTATGVNGDQSPFHVHELSLSGGRWQDVDLTALTGGPEAAPFGVAMLYDSVRRGIRTYYKAVTDGNHVRELFLYEGPPA